MKPKSFDGNALNNASYSSVVHMDVMGLAQVNPQMSLRDGTWPVLSGMVRPGKRIFVNIIILGSGVATKQKQLNQYFDPEDETPKSFNVTDDDGSTNERYVMAVCERLSTIPNSYGLEWIATLRIDGDIRFREITAETPSSWNITATGQTRVLANNGEDDCYPILKIKPTSAKTASWPYKRFMVVKWLVGAVSTYPVDIANNGLDTQIASTNFALASGDDLRVYVNGSEVDRWLDGPNTATTKVWVNLDFQADIAMTLNGAIGSGDTDLTVNESIANMPDSGILRIDTENITYTSKSNSEKKFYGLTRGAKGTTAASHTDTTSVFWLQHDIWIIYGNSSAGTPSQDDDYKPAFNLPTSSNTSWDYNDFNDDNQKRSGGWQFSPLVTGPEKYGGNQGATASPYVELGQKHPEDAGPFTSRYWVYNPCEIDSANFQNLEEYSDGWFDWSARIQSSPNGSTWNDEYTLSTGPTTGSWQSVSNRNETLNAGAEYVGIYLLTVINIDSPAYFECSDITLALDSSNTPVIVIGGEQSSYSLDCVITNNTTGDAVELAFVMEPNEQLELDTDEKTVIYLDDDTNQFQALTLTGGPRRDWLPLQPGNNTIQFDETGVNGLTIDFEYEERYYQ
jgi:hypothetical protein